MPIESRTSEVRAKDGLRLALHQFLPSGTPRAQILLLHGYADHGQRYAEAATAWAERGLSTLAVDLRGHGHSEGKRGYVEHFDEYFSDVDALFEAADPKLPIVLLAHSMGALLALDYVSRGRNMPHALVVTNPYLELAIAVPKVKLWVGQGLGQIVPKLTLPSGVAANDVTSVAEIARAYEQDPLVFKTATARWFLETKKAQARVRALERVDVPLLYIYSDADRIALPAASEALSAAIAAPSKTIWLRPGERHEVLNEKHRADLFADIERWISETLSLSNAVAV
jgi:alpha-beta hydrolase superfamily lysophospholipase